MKCSKVCKTHVEALLPILSRPAIIQKKGMYQIDHRKVENRMVLPALIGLGLFAGLTNSYFRIICKNAGYTSEPLKGACPMLASYAITFGSTLGIYGLELARAQYASWQKNKALVS